MGTAETFDDTRRFGAKDGGGRATLGDRDTNAISRAIRLKFPRENHMAHALQLSCT